MRQETIQCLHWRPCHYKCTAAFDSFSPSAVDKQSVPSVTGAMTSIFHSISHEDSDERIER